MRCIHLKESLCASKIKRVTERLFGTDGVRGLANDVITPALAMELAQAASIVLGFDTVEEGVRPPCRDCK